MSFELMSFCNLLPSDEQMISLLLRDAVRDQPEHNRAAKYVLLAGFDAHCNLLGRLKFKQSAVDF